MSNHVIEMVATSLIFAHHLIDTANAPGRLQRGEETVILPFPAAETAQSTENITETRTAVPAIVGMTGIAVGTEEARPEGVEVAEQSTGVGALFPAVVGVQALMTGAEMVHRLQRRSGLITTTPLVVTRSKVRALCIYAEGVALTISSSKQNPFRGWCNVSPRKTKMSSI